MEGEILKRDGGETVVLDGVKKFKARRGVVEFLGKRDVFVEGGELGLGQGCGWHFGGVVKVGCGLGRAVRVTRVADLF